MNDGLGRLDFAPDQSPTPTDLRHCLQADREAVLRKGYRSTTSAGPGAGTNHLGSIKHLANIETGYVPRWPQERSEVTLRRTLVRMLAETTAGGPLLR